MTRFNLRQLCVLTAVICGAPGCGSSSQKAALMGGEDAGDQPGMSEGGNSSAGAQSTTGGTIGSGSGGTSSNAAGTGGSPIKVPPTNVGPATVKCQDDFSMPANAPALKVNQWVAINPEGFPWDPDTSTLGFAVHPCNPGVLFVCTGSFDTAVGGLYRSDDAGTSWYRIGNVEKDWSGADHLQAPLRVRVDPKNPQHLYVAQGVRGRNGFWESFDGGVNLAEPSGFTALNATKQMTAEDVYDIAVDPTDFNHVLVVFHSAWGWTDTKWNTNSGVLETKDGGASFIVHEPQPTWGTGHAIAFLYDKELGIGNANTWLLGTQGAGRWRTDDAGKTWKKVTDVGIQHGGGTIYYDKKNKYLYASGTPHNQRSKDNGVTWEDIGDFGGATAIFGDGDRLYTAPVFGPNFSVSAESDGATWTTFTANQMFVQGPFDWAYDSHNKIVYASNWRAGLWALKLP